MTLDPMERIALALEVRALRAELAHGMLSSEELVADLERAVEDRLRRLADVDLDAAPASPAPCPTRVAMPGKRAAARRADPGTSAAAAARVSDKLTRVQGEVLVAFLEDGPMSARQCERAERWNGRAGFSTIRKRVSELASAGLLEWFGEERGTEKRPETPATVYRITVDGSRAAERFQAEATVS